MAYDKKYIENGDLVKEYLDDREDRIEEGFNNVETEFDEVHDKIDMVKDYVVEQGANYTKWNSGKLECYGKFTATNGTTQSQGAIFRSDTVQTVNFPVPFVGNAGDIELLLGTNGPGAFGIAFNSTSLTAFSFRLIHFISQTVDTPCTYYAVGRWK